MIAEQLVHGYTGHSQVGVGALTLTVGFIGCQTHLVKYSESLQRITNLR
jgi:hypothetical protein